MLKIVTMQTGWNEMKTPWFKFYVGDYMQDTQFLTPEEHGCYLLMILNYYSTGAPIPNDRFVLSKLFGISPQKTSKILLTLSRFFVEKDGKFFHERIEQELLIRDKNHKVAVDNGRKGGLAKAKAEYLAYQMSEVKINNNCANDQKTTNGKKHESEQRFNEFWQLYPRKKDKKKAHTAFLRLSANKQRAAIADIQQRYANVNQSEVEFIPYPTTYIRGERWDDEQDDKLNGNDIMKGLI